MDALTPEASKKSIRILVFGASGHGKTSLVNELTGQSLPIDNGLKGCTFETNKVSTRQDDIEYTFFDTMGVNELQSGSTWLALQNLIVLLREISRDGFHLLIMVHRGRLLENSKKNYELFFESIFGSKCPCIVVQTDIFSPKVWVAENSKQFLNNKMFFQEVIAGTFLQVPFQQIKEMRAETTKCVWEAIKRHASEKPIIIFPYTELAQRAKLIWNTFCHMTGMNFAFKDDLTIMESIASVKS